MSKIVFQEITNEGEIYFAPFDQETGAKLAPGTASEESAKAALILFWIAEQKGAAKAANLMGLPVFFYGEDSDFLSTAVMLESGEMVMFPNSWQDRWESDYAKNWAQAQGITEGLKYAL